MRAKRGRAATRTTWLDVARHPLTLYLLRYCALAGAAILTGVVVNALRHWIDLPLALILYLPLVLLVGLWWDLMEVVLVLVCAVGLTDYLFNRPPARLWPVSDVHARLDYLVFILVGLIAGLLAMRSRRQHQRAALADAAIEANRLRLELIAALAQEISAPVRALDEHTQDLLAEGSEAPSYHLAASLQMIAAQSRRLRGILDNLAQTARMGDGPILLDRGRVPLRHLVQGVADEFVAFVPDHPCRLLADTREIVVFGDAARLRQVLANLLDNAARYSVSGATVTITLAVQDSEALLGVIDQGIGIMKAERERAFDRYGGGGVLTRVVGGSGPGLGLALCRGIVEAHGGRIWLDNGTNGGVTVRVALPLYGGDGPALIPAD